MNNGHSFNFPGGIPGGVPDLGALAGPPQGGPTMEQQITAILLQRAGITGSDGRAVWTSGDHDDLTDMALMVVGPYVIALCAKIVGTGQPITVPWHNVARLCPTGGM